MPLVDEDGFTHVLYKDKKKKKSKKAYCRKPIGLSLDASMLLNFHSVIKNIVEEIENCDFSSMFWEDFQLVMSEWKVVDVFGGQTNDLSNIEKDPENKLVNEIDIICYGLGQFSLCPIARYQLGFLLFLRNALKPSNVQIYDPQFSPEEKDFLSQLHLTVLEVNEEAKRIVSRKSVFFMPHCDLPLYNNLLWANWNEDKLLNLVIIGNSFQNYEIGKTKSDFQSKAKYVYLATKFVTEIKLRNRFQFADIFNDLAIHFFKSCSLCELESYIFHDMKEPEYSDDELIKYCL